MPKVMTVLCASMLAVALAGCTLFRGHASHVRADEARAEREIPYDGGFEYAFARAALLEGHYGAAIQSLHRAELYPKYRAASANGLAIAYSALGRDDLAIHFFRKAVEEEPDAAKYRANLAAHETRMAYAEQAERQRLALAAPPRPTERSAVVRLVTANDGSSSVVPDSGGTISILRLSEREIRLVDERMAENPHRPSLALGVNSRRGLR